MEVRFGPVFTNVLSHRQLGQIKSPRRCGLAIECCYCNLAGSLSALCLSKSESNSTTHKQAPNPRSVPTKPNRLSKQPSSSYCCRVACSRIKSNLPGLVSSQLTQQTNCVGAATRWRAIVAATNRCSKRRSCSKINLSLNVATNATDAVALSGFGSTNRLDLHTMAGAKLD